MLRLTSCLAVLVVLIVLVGSSDVLRAVEFVALSVDENKFYSVNTSDLANPTLIGSVPVGTNLYGAVNVDSGTIYTFDRDANVLIVYDTSNGTVHNSVSLDQDVWVTRRGFDRSPDGILFGVLPGMQLRTVDPLTGRTTLVAPITGAPKVESIAFSPDGTLYAVGSLDDNFTSEHLFTLSVTTGVLTSIGPMDLVDADTLTFASDGFLYTTDTAAGNVADLMRIDPTTGHVTNLGSTGLVAVGGLAAVPEPSTLILLTMGAVGLLAYARRRRR